MKTALFRRPALTCSFGFFLGFPAFLSLRPLPRTVQGLGKLLPVNCLGQLNLRGGDDLLLPSSIIPPNQKPRPDNRCQVQKKDNRDIGRPEMNRLANPSPRKTKTMLTTNFTLLAVSAKAIYWLCHVCRFTCSFLSMTPFTILSHSIVP